MPTIYRNPVVTLLSKPDFTLPEHMPVHFLGDATPGEQLVEFAGRLCYMSQRNPAERTTAEYIQNIMRQGHGSVLEHANYSLLLEGVSRTLTHELIRHRAGMAYSELSQRFVNMEDAAFVMPPSIQGLYSLEVEFTAHCMASLDMYEEVTDRIMKSFDLQGLYQDDKTLKRKRAREAARSFLPNSTETKIVATGNVRAWRHILTMRGAEGADKEINRLARAVHHVLVDAAPTFFGDFVESESELVPEFLKV